MSNELEHMLEKWRPTCRRDGRLYITTDKAGLAMCECMLFLPGDPTGELTARAICDAHNAAIDGAADVVGYRILEVGEVVEKGDVFMTQGGSWRTVSASVGMMATPRDAGRLRRPIRRDTDTQRQLDECRAMLVAARTDRDVMRQQRDEARTSEKSWAESNEKLSAEVGRLRKENEGLRSDPVATDRMLSTSANNPSSQDALDYIFASNGVEIRDGVTDLDAYAAAHQPAESSPRERIIATIACGLIASGSEFDAKAVVRMADELIKEMAK